MTDKPLPPDLDDIFFIPLPGEDEELEHGDQEEEFTDFDEEDQDG